MTLPPSQSEKLKPSQSREILRNCGQLLGQIDGLFPFLYIAQVGASGRMLRVRTTNEVPGLFVVCERDESGRGYPHVGLILPVNLCRDEQTRMALHEVAAFAKGSPTSNSVRRREVRAKLEAVFGDDLTIDDREILDGFFALKPGPGLFQRLCDSFDYVTEALDNAAGTVRVTNTAQFRWRSYGELMEWFHDVYEGNRFGTWSALRPYFVCGNTAALKSYATERWARVGLRTPAEAPSKWFTLRPDVSDAAVDVRLEMGKYAWAYLHLTVGYAKTTIFLSEVYDPFDELVAFGREIDEGDLPVQIEIDEEGSVAVLMVLRTDTPERILLRVTETFSEEIRLEGIVSRAVLAAALKTELRRFFTTEFDPEHWDTEEHDDDYVPLEERVLNNAWISK